MDETTPLIDSQTNGHLTHHPATEPETEPELDFDAKGDQDDPQQWKLIYKWGIVSLMAFMSFTVTFNCISLVPVAPNIVADLDGRSGNRSTSYAAVLLVTIWELGEAAGPLLIAPLSEVYGRWPVLNVANALFIASTIIAALSPSTSLLIFARFLTGTAVATNVLNPAVIGDMFPPDQRGTPMSTVMLAPLTGGAIGPVVAGAIAQTTGWRYIVYISVALAVIAETLFFFCLKETYRPAILRKRAREHGAVTNGATKRGGDAESLHDDVKGEDKGKNLVWESIKRPATIFGSSMVLQLFSLYGAVMFSFFYIMSTTLSSILQERYDFAPTLVGSSFLSFSEFTLSNTS
jgi:MFS family permease